MLAFPLDKGLEIDHVGEHAGGAQKRAVLTDYASVDTLFCTLHLSFRTTSGEIATFCPILLSSSMQVDSWATSSLLRRLPPETAGGKGTT